MFEVGQKVLCIDDKPRAMAHPGPVTVRAGCVYTVAKIIPRASLVTRMDGVILVEAHSAAPNGFYADRFRAIDDKDDAIEMFRQMTRDVKTILPVSEERLKELLKDLWR